MKNIKKIPFYLGIDIGSTTIKAVVLNSRSDLIMGTYERHFANIPAALEQVLEQAYRQLGDISVHVTFTGSAGMGLAQRLGTGFVQEVVASTKVLKARHPEVDAAIELGGEDAKIIYLSNGADQRMNGTCAGGTGSFIDQMASLLHVDAAQLNEMAKSYQEIYPIAARCGVFAKTDIQPLLNEGVSKEDLAASIFQAVVIQTISGLSCGRPIKGNVAFLGGPLYFLSELRQRFIETLDLSPEEVIFPENSQLYVAMGAAMSAKDGSQVFSLSQFKDKIQDSAASRVEELPRLEPLFQTEEAYRTFKLRHAQAQVKKRVLADFSGPCYLGIDAGSTTTKMALVSPEGELLFTHYGSNGGNPLASAISALEALYQEMPPGAFIASSAVTGYGESLLKSALNMDIGEIETVAHYQAANFFSPDVDFILDIGGQDMKCLNIKNGTIASLSLNEACSAGCGSFLDTFAQSMNLTIGDFVEQAIASQGPVDLGSRCTVFMNSRVKQAQKEGATIGDIASGLAYSVVRNALYKVIKAKDPRELGKNIVVQGGTLYNDAVLRALELSTGRQVVRPDIAGIMGAFGAALIALKRHDGQSVSGLHGPAKLKTFSSSTRSVRCKACHNHCLMTLHQFEGGGRFLTGNRCEKGAGKQAGTREGQLPNLAAYRLKRVFEYPVLTREKAKRGTVGLPRVLNMYENYPFWAAFFTYLDFSVILSRPTTKKIYEKGMASIPSESACYPAKLVHGHVVDLLEQNVDLVFYPSIIHEDRQDPRADNHFNCPVVTSYPEVIKNNLDELQEQQVPFLHPFLPFSDQRKLSRRLYQVFSGWRLSMGEVGAAVAAAWQEQERFRNDLRQMGEETLKLLSEKGLSGIVLAGRPYHTDPHINHGIPEMINALGLAVLTEDSVAHLGRIQRPLRVMDQWAYHTRLYGAAHFTASQDNLELVQLNSFGCGLDAVTTDQVQEIMESHSKVYTTLKVDEGSNLGAARIRIRSLQAAMAERKKAGFERKYVDNSYKTIPFTKEMRKTHTILCPQLSPLNFDFLEEAFIQSGYNLVVLPSSDDTATETGLKYVNNDACYPAILVVGQVLAALQSGRYDPAATSVIMSQTGGGCRASCYVGFIRKALRDAGFGHIPVISLSAQGFESNPGFKISLPLLNRAMMATIYGDLFMNVLYRTRPYETEAGAANLLYEKWKQVCLASLANARYGEFKQNIEAVVAAFDRLPLHHLTKPKVGLVGEILVKFHPAANNQVVEVVEGEGAEAVMPGLMDFLLYCAFVADRKGSGKTLAAKLKGDSLVAIIEKYRSPMKKALADSVRFTPPIPIGEIAQKASQIIDLGHKTGEGWLLTGEMVELIEMGVPNIICMQPFACLPNHIVGKGVIKTLRQTYPLSNVVAIDYDPGASEVNQLNRIKLMLAAAFENLKVDEAIPPLTKPATKDLPPKRKKLRPANQNI